MLRLLFQSIEQSLGPSLTQVSYLLYCGSFALLAAVALVPVARVWMDYATVHTGLERRWIMTCGRCGKSLIVTGPTCRHCNAHLGIPWTVRLWTGFTGKREGTLTRRLRWVWHLLGSAFFVLLSFWIITAAGTLTPQGSLHRLLSGIAILALAAFGWFGGRALSLAARGIMARVGDAVMALATIGIMTIAFFLADAAKPSHDIPLARFTATDGSVRLGERTVPLATGEIGFEYLQLDHELLGYHHIIPLAVLGTERAALPKCAIENWAVSHLQKQADAYAARGFTVRLRNDRLRVAPGQSYEVVQHEGQVLIKRTEEGNLPL